LRIIRTFADIFTPLFCHCAAIVLVVAATGVVPLVEMLANAIAGALFCVPGAGSEEVSAPPCYPGDRQTRRDRA